MKSMKLLAATSTILLSQLAFMPVWASGDHAHKHHATKPADATSAVDIATMSDAEVRKVDKDAKKITLKHGEIKNLEMPAMTMVFQVKDTALLDKVKVGDKVKFKAEKVASGYAVTEIEMAR